MSEKIKKVLEKLDEIKSKPKRNKKESVKEEIKIIKKSKLSTEEIDRLNSEFFYLELRKVHENNDILTLETLKELRG